MDEFRIPLSKIIDLAKKQACTYWLECHELANDMSRNKWKRFEAEQELKYWDQVYKYLNKLLERRIIP